MNNKSSRGANCVTESENDLLFSPLSFPEVDLYITVFVLKNN